MMQGRCEEARAALEAEPIRWVRLTGRTLLLARTGQQQAARGELTAFQKEFGDNATYQYAQIEAQLGDKDGSHAVAGKCTPGTRSWFDRAGIQ